MIVAALPQFITGVVSFILSASTMITEAVSKIILAIAQMAPDILATLVGTALPEIITGLISAIIGNAPALCDAIMELTMLSLVVVPMIIVEIVKRIPEIFTAIINTFKEKWPAIKEAGYQVFEQAMDGMFSDSIYTELGVNVGLFIGEAIQKLKSYIDTFKQAGQDIMNGLIDGIKDKINEVNNVISGVASGISSAFKTMLGISSPSKVFEQFGQFIDEGLADGIVGGTSEVLGATNQLSTSLTDGFNATLLTPSYNRQPSLAVAGVNGGGAYGQNFGPITIPVYIGQRKIETIVIDAINAHNYLTGGR